jgi:radical SAM-linked protein
VDALPDRSRPEPRQRWRLVLRRSADAPASTQRELAEAWERVFLESGLPIAMTEAAVPRPRVSFGAPISTGIAAEAELLDVVLTERVPLWRVREALEGRLPPGWSLVDLHDVWLAGPALAGQVVAADYRIELAGANGAAVPPAERIVDAARGLLDAPALSRQRAKGGGLVTYDLRPLLVDVLLVDPGPPVVIGARTRFHPELGTGRPEEVVAALGDRLGVALTPAAIVRERLVLAGD